MIPALLSSFAANPQGALQSVGQFAQTAAGLAQTGQQVVGQLRNVFNPSAARREQQTAQRNQLLSAVLASAMRPPAPPPPPRPAAPVRPPVQVLPSQPTYIPPPPPVFASQSAEIVQQRSTLPQPSVVPGAPQAEATSAQSKGISPMMIVAGGALALGAVFLMTRKK